MQSKYFENSKKVNYSMIYEKKTSKKCQEIFKEKESLH